MGVVIWLQAPGGLYLTSDKKRCVVGSDDAGKREQFEVSRLGQHVALRTYFGKFWCCDSHKKQKLVANRKNVSHWELLTLEFHDDSQVAIKGHTGQYLTHDAGKPKMYFSHDSVGEAQLFRTNLQPGDLGLDRQDTSTGAAGQGVHTGVQHNRGGDITWSTWSTGDFGGHIVKEEKWENKRRLVVGGWKNPFLKGDPYHWSDCNGDQFKEVDAPGGEGWAWRGDWEVEKSAAVDEEGWEYAVDWSFRGWHSNKKATDFARRRKWVRVRQHPGANHEWPEEDHANHETNLVALIQKGLRMALSRAFLTDGALDTPDSLTKYYQELRHHTESFYFHDYAPQSFARLRYQFGISTPDYIEELCDQPIQGGGKGAGKSGQIFWRSADNRFVIKTVSEEEQNTVRDFLASYVTHFHDHPHSLLSRFYSMHKIIVKPGTKQELEIRFVIMNNVFETRLPIQLKYDLKGTKEDRLVSEETIRQSGGVQKTILKDLNFNSRTIDVSAGLQHALHVTIERDSKLLLSHEIMDYSLLLGVRVAAEGENENDDDDETQAGAMLKQEAEASEVTDVEGPLLKDSHGRLVSIFQQQHGGVRGPPNTTYYIGVIDILQTWTNHKKFCGLYKQVAYADFKEEFIDSAQPPVYSERFIHYLRRKIRDREQPDAVVGDEDEDERPVTLSVIVYEGRNLRICDKYSHKSDPYVEVTFGCEKVVTPIIKSNLNPTWNHLCVFNFQTPADLSCKIPLHFLVLDYDFGSDPDFMGQYEVDVAPLLTGEDTSRPFQWLKLKHPEDEFEEFGEIKVGISVVR